MELFAKGPGNMALLLRLLEEESPSLNDFYVRYYIVQLLTVLAVGNSYRLQQARPSCCARHSCACARACMCARVP